jgi:hypothetical protein
MECISTIKSILLSILGPTVITRKAKLANLRTPFSCEFWMVSVITEFKHLGQKGDSQTQTEVSIVQATLKAFDNFDINGILTAPPKSPHIVIDMNDCRLLIQVHLQSSTVFINTRIKKILT